MAIMLKYLSSRANLFLFVRRHQHIEYYFNLRDSRCAANENGILSSNGPAQRDSSRRANVFAIHPLAQAWRRQR
jgi:hypothetical protein